VRVEWSQEALESAARFMADQPGMRAINAAATALAADALPGPPDGFHRGDYHRLRVGDYRILYVIQGDLVTVGRVDRILRP